TTTSPTQPASADPEEITVHCGLDDIILSYRSDYWIEPDLDDGIQQWDVGMHFVEDGPGPQFGSIRLHVIDNNRCLDPIQACDLLSEDLLTISKALYDPVLGDVRQDVWDRVALPGNTLVVDRVSIDPRLRGHGLGILLTGMALDYFSHGNGVIALFPGPVERDSTPYEEACTRLGNAWARLGFTPYRDGVWILDPALTTLDAALITEHQRLADHRWAVRLRPHPDGWGSDITGITSVNATQKQTQ
ncbi:hypothetical protein, partial [Streptomyces sp. NPDC060131]|uniref:hypothetical protein n=1 Tax=Streptomyces sp. NPDC060131 TaxID=3347058 RepID=UPI003664AE8C